MEELESRKRFNDFQMGRYLQKLRLERGMTPGDVAMGINSMFIVDQPILPEDIESFESGKERVPAKTLLAMGQVMGVSINDLFSDYRAAQNDNSKVPPPTT